ncbi:MAG: hypothetical protein ACOCQG_05260 [Candidatus Nanoarchaeia archaeon]
MGIGVDNYRLCPEAVFDYGLLEIEFKLETDKGFTSLVEYGFEF